MKTDEKSIFIHTGCGGGAGLPDGTAGVVAHNCGPCAVALGWFGRAGYGRSVCFMDAKGKSVMNALRIAAEQLKKDEGFRGTVYSDFYGNLTIGYGFNLEYPLTEEECEPILNLRVQRIDEALQERIDNYSRLSRNRQSVLINMAYQMGVRGLMKFEKTIKYIERGWHHSASREMLDSQWAQTFSTRAERLSEIYRRG